MNHFLSSEIPNYEKEKALFHIIPAPMEMSVSYGRGTADGPRALLEASDQLEIWDGQSIPCDEGICTFPAVKADDAPGFIKAIRNRAADSLEAGGIPVLIGGEHSVTLGAAQAVFEKYGKDVGLIHIDAHADLREDYEGNPYSHASVIRKVHEMTGWPTVQIGIRAYCEEEHEYQREQGIRCITGAEAARKSLEHLDLPEDFPKKIYLSFDADGLDSSIMPATGTPVPGGLGWYQSMNIIESVCSRRSIIGFDFVELAPEPHLRFCDFTAAQAVYNIMGMIQRSRKALSF